MRKDFNRIWSFGFVSGNKYWLCWCINKDNPLGEVSIWIKNGKNNFIFTNLGPDIIWLGRTYTTSCFTKALNLDEKTEKLVWVSPIGYRNPNKKGLINYFSKRKRNDWNKKFFFEKPSMPMTEEKCSFFKKEVIGAIRWLPTAVNKQDYVVVFKDKTAHVFSVCSSMCYLCDGGIGITHVKIGCLGNGLNGHWEKLKEVFEDLPQNWKYFASFIY